MESIKIIKHSDPPISVNEKGDILYPFEQFDLSRTGGGWYSKPSQNLYTEMPFIPLVSINENPWTALEELNINTAEFKDKVKYICPYTGYEFYWCVPVCLLSQDLSFWTKRTVLPEWKTQRFANFDFMKKFQPLAGENGFRFTKIQRAFLGTGYTLNTRNNEGDAYLYDAILALSTGQDFLGAKVWLWFSKMGTK